MSGLQALYLRIDYFFRQKNNDVRGMMVIDKSGLCLECISLFFYCKASGTLKSRFAMNQSGLFRDMSQKCTSLLDDDISEALIEIKTDKQYYIQSVLCFYSKYLLRSTTEGTSVFST